MRRIQIRQELRIDSISIERADGSIGYLTQQLVEDIPDGDYLEYYPNGSLHVQGKLAGFNNEGIPLKDGEWIEYDQNGDMISRKVYP